MPITKFYGGFNPAWRAGRLEREIVDNISDQLALQYPDQNCVVAVPSWHEPSVLVDDIKNLNPDFTVICSLSDPLGPIEDLLDTIPGRVHKFGYVDHGIKFDFWALACLKFFKKYSREEIILKEFSKIYLNYNRKPHRHRLELVNLFENSDLIKYGITTLGDSAYTLNESDDDYLEYGANDVMGDVGIPNDIYSLGRLDIWNSTFLNIVSETQYEYNPNAFISEKIYKPIIGLRPFIINGSPSIYKWLQNLGFDCFEDIFPVDKFKDESAPLGYKFRNHELIAKVVQELTTKNLQDLYYKLLPRLEKNQILFYEHARNQQLYSKFNI
jgi:hypothetical protein